MTNLPTKTTSTVTSMLMDPASFDQIYRVGKMLASSILFPEHLRKGTPEQAAANGALVMNMAMRLNEDPLTVAQNIYFVGGKPGWSTSYLIAKANQHGAFKGAIDWDITGEGGSLSVTAKATLADTGREVSFTCDMAMAKADGWTKNAKYQSMPELMLRYRSATALIRLYCPEVMVGVPAQIEVETGMEMRDVTPPAPRETAKPVAKEKAVQKAEPEDAKVVHPDTDKPAAKQEGGETEQHGADHPAKAKEPPEAMVAKFNMIMTDLVESGNLGAVLSFYGDAGDIAKLQAEAPGLHAELMAKVDEMERADAEDGA